MKTSVYPIQRLIAKRLREASNNREHKDRTGWYASELGNCMRQSYMKRLGLKADEEFDDRTLRVFDVGYRDEDFTLQDLEKAIGVRDPRFPFIKKFEREIRVEDKELHVSGRMDGLITYEDDEQEVIEAKSKNSRSFWYMDKKGEGANEQHTWQIWIYLWITGVKIGQICYVSKDDLTMLQYPIFRNDEKIKKNVLERLKSLNDYWDRKVVPPKMDSKSWQCRYCQYKKTCKKM